VKKRGRFDGGRRAAGEGAAATTGWTSNGASEGDGDGDAGVADAAAAAATAVAYIAESRAVFGKERIASKAAADAGAIDRDRDDDEDEAGASGASEGGGSVVGDCVSDAAVAASVARSPSSDGTAAGMPAWGTGAGPPPRVGTGTSEPRARCPDANSRCCWNGEKVATAGDRTEVSDGAPVPAGCGGGGGGGDAAAALAVSAARSAAEKRAGDM
jgi:hypothetical protein